MKLIPTFLAKHLPVSRKAHTASMVRHHEALAKAHTQAEMDTTWLLEQLQQVTAANVRLERHLLDTNEG